MSTSETPRNSNIWRNTAAVAAAGLLVAGGFRVYDMVPNETSDPGSMQISETARWLASQIMEDPLKETHDGGAWTEQSVNLDCASDTDTVFHSVVSADINYGRSKFLTIDKRKIEASHAWIVMIKQSATVDTSGINEYYDIFMEKTNHGWTVKVLKDNGEIWVYPSESAVGFHAHDQTLDTAQLDSVLEQARTLYSDIVVTGGCTDVPTSF